MLLGFVMLFGYALIVWLVFFKFKWAQFSIAWGVVSVFVGLHLLIIFMIGVRFVTPFSMEAKMIQHTIQLTPRLSGADTRHGGAGGAERPRQEGDAAVPVRPAYLRVQS